MERVTEPSGDSVLDPMQLAAALTKLYHHNDQEGIVELIKAVHEDGMSPYSLLMAALTINKTLVGYMSSLMKLEEIDILDTLVYSTVK